MVPVVKNRFLKLARHSQKSELEEIGSWARGKTNVIFLPSALHFLCIAECGFHFPPNSRGKIRGAISLTMYSRFV